MENAGASTSRASRTRQGCYLALPRARHCQEYARLVPTVPQAVPAGLQLLSWVGREARGAESLGHLLNFF